MSLLNPGGYRGPTFYSGRDDNRIFGFDTIRRSCNQALKARCHRTIAETSIAQGKRQRHPKWGAFSFAGDRQPHEHQREKARHLRQMEGAR